MVGFILTFGILFFAVSTSWAEVECGQEIGPDAVAYLTKDLDCSEGLLALTVKSGSVLNLGGHRVTCSGRAFMSGISLTGRGAHLTNGTVSGCFGGVGLGGEGGHTLTKVTVNNGFFCITIGSDDNTLSYNTAGQCLIGFFLSEAKRNTLKKNLARGPGFAGFGEEPGEENVYINNRAIGSPMEIGFSIEGNRAKLSGNLAKNANMNGFTLNGEDMRVRFNTAIGNGEEGFQIETGSGLKVSGNTVLKNKGDGIRLDQGVTNSEVHGNIAFGNKGTDLLDENVDCDENKWRFNFFKTRNQKCIR